MLADQGDFGRRSGQAEPLGDGGGQRGARIVVGADHGGELDAGEFGENGLDLVERIGGKGLAARRIADQVFQAGAGIVVEEIFDAGRGKEGQFAIVAMSGADDEDRLVGFGEAPRFGGVLSISKFSHGRSFIRSDGSIFLHRRPSLGLIGAADLSTVRNRCLYISAKLARPSPS